MKKLLVVCDLINGSGVTEFVFNVFGNFNPKKYSITVVGYGNIRVEETNNRAIKMGWKVYRAPIATKDVFKHWNFWKEFFRKSRFDIAYFNYSSSWNFLPIVYAKKSGVAMVACHSHNSYFSHQFSNKLLNYFLELLNKIGRVFINRYSDIELATSIDAAKWMFGHGFRKRVHIVKNGIELDKYIYMPIKRKELRKSIGVKESDYVIGFMGALVQRKNPIFALHVFKRFLNKMPNSFLVFVGSGQMKYEIEHKAEQLGIINNIKLLGYSSGAHDWYSAFDILMFPSLFEGFGLVALEAQISNLPVIASDKIPMGVLVNNNTKQLSTKNGIISWSEELENMVKNLTDRNTFNEKLTEFDSKKQARIILNLLICSDRR